MTAHAKGVRAIGIVRGSFSGFADSQGTGMSAEPRSNFLRTQIQADLEAARVDALGDAVPPEPNGLSCI